MRAVHASIHSSAAPAIFVGCCGARKSLKEYSKIFNTLEVQSTFYRLPRKETAEKWRKEVPKEFVFSVKCFQGVTHPCTSPTWRRYRGELEGRKENYGLLQPTDEVFNSWEGTKEICRVLKAKFCLIQLPASFRETEENIANAFEFFRRIKPQREEFKIAVELRGWSEENIKRLCAKYNLIDCCDIFAREPVCPPPRTPETATNVCPETATSVAYIRLHGSPPGRKMYSYKYTARDFKILKEKLESLAAKEIYLYFNNIYMFEDAKRFKKYIQR